MSGLYAHRGRIELSRSQLTALLGLPADVEIVAVEARFDPAGVDVLVMGPSIAPVPAGSAAPVLPWRVPARDSASTEPAEPTLTHCARIGCDAVLRKGPGDEFAVQTTMHTPAHNHIWES